MSTKAIQKQLIAAIAMVLVAAIALGSSTYAWFVQSGTVEATGMQVKAQAETGIVIKSVDNTSSEWASTASAGMTSGTALYPTSTVDCAAWYHANSDLADDAKAAQAKANYENVTSTASGKYMLMKTFKIRSASTSVSVTNVDLYVDSVAVTKTTSTSESLDKAVRVGVKIGETVYVYAPMEDNDWTLTAKYIDESTPTTLTEKKAAAATDKFILTDHTIAAADESAVIAYVYMWFEGEDANCKSTNITATMDNLSVTVDFATVAAS